MVQIADAVEFRLTLEAFPRKDGGMDKGRLPFGVMTIKADTREEAIQALQDFITGKISYQDIPKTGLDLRKKSQPLNKAPT